MCSVWEGKTDKTSIACAEMILFARKMLLVSLPFFFFQTAFSKANSRSEREAKLRIQSSLDNRCSLSISVYIHKSGDSVQAI